MLTFHYHIIINPASGGGSGKQAGNDIIELLKKNQFLFSTYFTQYPGHERLFAKELIESTLIPWEEESILADHLTSSH